jgi:hypothetical protein
LVAASDETITTDEDALVATAMVTDEEEAVTTMVMDREAMVRGGCVLVLVGWAGGSPPFSLLDV